MNHFYKYVCSDWDNAKWVNLKLRHFWHFKFKILRNIGLCQFMTNAKNCDAKLPADVTGSCNFLC